MPTGAKIVSALFFMVFGYFVADIVKPLLPEGTPTGLMNETVAAVGFVMGWTVTGGRAGDGVRASIGYGLTVVILIALWSGFFFSFAEMLQLSMDRRYRGPMHAIKSMIGIGIRNYQLLADTNVIIAMLVGGAFGGWITEWAAKRWT